MSSPASLVWELNTPSSPGFFSFESFVILACSGLWTNFVSETPNAPLNSSILGCTITGGAADPMIGPVVVRPLSPILSPW